MGASRPVSQVSQLMRHEANASLALIKMGLMRTNVQGPTTQISLLPDPTLGLKLSEESALLLWS